MVDLIPERPKKGRGAVSNASGRYEPFTRVAIDDGWGEAGTAVGGDGFGEPPAPPTEVTWDATRTILTRNNSPDTGSDRPINPYRACAHGCTYSFTRQTPPRPASPPALHYDT